MMTDTMKHIAKYHIGESDPTDQSPWKVLWWSVLLGQARAPWSVVWPTISSGLA